MKISALLVASGIFGVTSVIPMAMGQTASEQKMFTPQDIKWSPGPPSLPAGAEVAVLYGDPTKEGLFAIRLKVPKGYRVAPHSHPRPEVATVLSGTVRLSMGETSNAKTHEFPAGSFYATPAEMVHSFSANEETVVQINSTGPWGIKYVNPKDDPRQKTQ
jgi:quercetin dioxygenase-like cupin family protein